VHRVRERGYATGMLTFSDEPTVAEQQMHAVLFFMVTFGYIDGDFDAAEKDYVKKQITSLVEQRVDGAMPDADPKLRAELIGKYTTHFREVFEGIDRHVRELLLEPVAAGEDQNGFVRTKLKTRCFEILQSFDVASREGMMTAIDELIMADGTAHPAELEFRAEMASLLESDLDVELEDDAGGGSQIRIESPSTVPSDGANHPFFNAFEFHYAKETDKMLKQVAADRALLDRVIATLEEQRAKGRGKLTGKKNVAELAGEEPFLDGHVYVVPPKPGRSYELIVLGDLHGCYSVLKATILQSKFFDKVNAFRDDPEHNPEPKLVLLGDYIDRGMFSLNGVLRTVMQLFVTAPEFVHVLRGNHEYFIEHEGKIYGGVRPAESINTLKPYLSMDVFRHYMKLFDAMPNMLLFEKILFVHGGIARDRLLKERYKDLSSLNDKDIRFQMMWSDPSSADVIPADLQDKSNRFAFGRLQLRAFLQRIGCHTLVRGHEKTNKGIERVYEGDAETLITLFSSGGSDNDDLPKDSSYRSVTPMVLTIKRAANGETTFTPWSPDYKAYNDPAKNAFFKVPPEIEHKAD
jgi:hypothetical protein